MKKFINFFIAGLFSLAIPYVALGLLWVCSAGSFSYSAAATNELFITLQVIVTMITMVATMHAVNENDLDFFKWD